MTGIVTNTILGHDLVVIVPYQRSRLTFEVRRSRYWPEPVHEDRYTMYWKVRYRVKHRIWGVSLRRLVVAIIDPLTEAR